MYERTPDPSPLPAAFPGRRSAARRSVDRRVGRGAAHRRAALGRDRGRGGRKGPSRATTIIVSALVTFLVGSLLLVGAVAMGTVAAVAALSQGLPDPTNLAALTFSQPTVVYDRTGKIQLGRFQREQPSRSTKACMKRGLPKSERQQIRLL